MSAYLVELGVVRPPEAAAASGRYELLLQGFAEYLLRERGVASHMGTVRDYGRIARPFLAEAVRATDAGLADDIAGVTSLGLSCPAAAGGRLGGHSCW